MVVSTHLKKYQLNWIISTQTGVKIKKILENRHLESYPFTSIHLHKMLGLLTCFHTLKARRRCKTTSKISMNKILKKNILIWKVPVVGTYNCMVTLVLLHFSNQLESPQSNSGLMFPLCQGLQGSLNFKAHPICF